jgi:hypothetical protein
MLRDFLSFGLGIVFMLITGLIVDAIGKKKAKAAVSAAEGPAE